MDFYYNPGKYGLTVIGEIDWSSGEYEFNLTVVWKHEDGRFLMGDDQGCSCPTPFEDIDFNDLTELTSLAQFSEHCFGQKRAYDRALALSVLVEKLHAAGLR